MVLNHTADELILIKIELTPTVRNYKKSNKSPSLQLKKIELISTLHEKYSTPQAAKNNQIKTRKNIIIRSIMRMKATFQISIHCELL